MIDLCQACGVPLDGFATYQLSRIKASGRLLFTQRLFVFWQPGITVTITPRDLITVFHDDKQTALDALLYRSLPIFPVNKKEAKLPGLT